MDIILLFGFAGLGALAGLLAGLFGLGGGVIIIPGLVYLFKTSGLISEHLLMHIALGTSLTTVIFTTAIAGGIHFKQKNIHWPLVKQLVPGLLVGALIGPYLGSQLSTYWLTLCFAAFLALIALRFIFNWHSDKTFAVPATLTLWFVGAAIASLTSILGLGGGVLLIPFLSYLPLTMREVSATSLACIFPVVIVAMLGYIIFGLNTPDLPRFATGYVYWPAVLPIILASSLFTPLGIKLAKSISTAQLKKLLGVFLLLLSISLFIF